MSYQNKGQKWGGFSYLFSNSLCLIIHQVKTKEIVTVTGFWYLNKTSSDFTMYFSVSWPFVLISIEKIYQTLETGLIIFSNPSNFVKNTLLHESTLFSGFGNVIKPCLSGLTYYIKAWSVCWSWTFYYPDL